MKTTKSARRGLTQFTDWQTRSVMKLFEACLAVVILSGCQSTGYVKSDAAAWHLESTANTLNAEGASLDGSLAALNDLTTNPSGDLRVQFGRFSDAVDKLSSLSSRASGNFESLRKRGAAYFETWNKELLKMNDDQIRQASADRKAQVSSQFESAMGRYRDSQSALTPLIRYLQDIRKALSTDLTIAGVHAANVPVQNANQTAAGVKQNLAQAAGDLNSLGGAMSFMTASPSK